MTPSLASARCRYRLPEGRTPNTTALSPDGKLLAVAGLDNDIDVWGLPGWIKHRTIRGRTIDKRNTRSRPQFTSDSKQLLAFDINQFNLHFLELASGKSVRKIRCPRGRTTASSA